MTTPDNRPWPRCYYCGTRPDTDTLEVAMASLKACTNCKMDIKTNGKWSTNGHDAIAVLSGRFGYDAVNDAWLGRRDVEAKGKEQDVSQLSFDYCEVKQPKPAKKKPVVPECIWRREATRTDFHPYGREYWCRNPKPLLHWLGFFPAECVTCKVRDAKQWEAANA